MAVDALLMEFKSEGRDNAGSCLDDYSEEEVELMNSRHRLNCEASERSSHPDQDNDDEINEFKREIEERFKLSIANKIYTFPKRIHSLSDFLSSSEDEDPDPLPLQPHRNFKKKSPAKQVESKARLNDSSLKCYDSSGRGVDSVKKGKDKMKTNDSTGKRNEDPRDKERISKGDKNDRSEKTAVQKKEKERERERDKEREKEKERRKGDRLKTEAESGGSFLETIRSKVGKKN
jgi:hypothetical protein